MITSPVAHDCMCKGISEYISCVVLQQWNHPHWNPFVNPHVVMPLPQLYAFLFLLFSATEWLLLLQRSVTKGRGPKHCVLAFSLHKSQLPNKHSGHGDRDRAIEAKLLVLAGKMLCFYHCKSSLTQAYYKKTWKHENYSKWPGCIKNKKLFSTSPVQLMSIKCILLLIATSHAVQMSVFTQDYSFICLLFTVWR